tara:strand:+ start:1333 stop:1539 length:207 start_codon:yes stop_codon:yes gene_type:complete
MICPTCNSTGVIIRPKNIVITYVTDFGGNVTEHKTNLGGQDCCPDCRFQSEAEWQRHTQLQALGENHD